MNIRQKLITGIVVLVIALASFIWVGVRPAAQAQQTANVEYAASFPPGEPPVHLHVSWNG